MSSAFRRAAFQTVQEYARFNPIFLDTETTGLHNSAEIIEISLVDYNGEVLLDTLVKPRYSIPWDVVQVHGITDELVAGAPSWPEVWPWVQNLLQGRYVGIYNADFDIRMIKQSHDLNKMSLDMSMDRFFCIMKLYARYRGSNRWQKLETAGRQCGLALRNTHRAKDDTLLTRAIFQYMVNSF